MNERSENVALPTDDLSLADWDACDEHETTFPKGDACPRCPGGKDYDPTTWCAYGHKTEADCDCGPIADNE